MIDDRIQQLEEKDEALEEEFRQDLNLLLNKIQTLYGQIDEEESGSASAESKTSITTQENSIKKRARELDEHIGDLQIKIQQIDEDMARIESAFDSLKVSVIGWRNCYFSVCISMCFLLYEIQEAAGETDIDKILEMFSEEEDINFSYFKYIQVSQFIAGMVLIIIIISEWLLLVVLCRKLTKKRMNCLRKWLKLKKKWKNTSMKRNIVSMTGFRNYCMKENYSRIWRRKMSSWNTPLKPRSSECLTESDLL